jgi:thioredoxin-related protein
MDFVGKGNYFCIEGHYFETTSHLMRALIPVIIVSLTGLTAFVGAPKPSTAVQWTTFQELNTLASSSKWSKQKRKVVVDLYTDWCGWCKRMDAATYANPEIAAYMNEHYYAIKFDAEQKDSVVFGGRTYKFIVTQQLKDQNGNVVREKGTHELALALGSNNGRIGYPTTVFLDEDLNLLQALPGYLGPDQFKPMLEYFGGDHHKTTAWDTYLKNYNDPYKEGTIGD